MNGSMPDHDRSTGTGLTMQHVGIAGAVGAVLLGMVVAVVIAVTPENGGGPGKRAAAAPPTTSTKAAPSAPAGSAAPKPSAKATISAPVVRWRGTLLLKGATTRRDLDAVPPRLSERNGEPDIRGDWLQPLVKAQSDAQVVLMRPRSEPSAVRCRDALATEGSDEVAVDEEDVVCVSTAAGRVARLTILKARITINSPIVRARVVIWDMPATGQ
ncbi:hypothetical protein SAMN06265355_102806 [Actinomadura mexicana]|uniref:Uncharacterized protein n=2 Tax=Actinomadura mexicana TaxID=134959 RepID=A0A238W8K8_9ACTN|nr:hypothetical protein SAMN06265355_102806 [Actinomadura mexicana]